MGSVSNGRTDAMEAKTKMAREQLKKCTLNHFERIIMQSKLTPRQQTIIRMKYIDNLLNYQIAMELNLSTATVDREIKEVHLAVGRLLNF